MAHMSGVFAPDDLSKWPAIDPNNPDYQRDLASLQVRGTGHMAQHGGHEMHGSSGASVPADSAVGHHHGDQ